MKDNTSPNSSTDNRNINGAVFLIPEKTLNSIIIKQDKILELLMTKRETGLNGFISEKQAMEILHKKGTWFWQMRTAGKLPFKKLGKTIYYSLSDINSLLISK